MLLVLTCLVLIGGAAIGGFALLAGQFGRPSALSLVVVTLVVTLTVTVFRYKVAVSNAGYEELTSDTFRYLQYGRQRWLNSETCCLSALTGDGTEGVLVLSQLGFAMFSDLWFAVFIAGSLIGLLGSWLFATSIKLSQPSSSPVYAYIVCLFPSVLYWSSSYGKEAFSQFAIGLGAASLACLWRRPRLKGRDLAWLGLGIALLVGWIVRPEMAILVVFAAAIATLGVVESPQPRVRWPLLFGFAGVLLVLFLLTTAGVIGDSFGLVEDLASRHDRTSLGKSQLGSARPGGLLGLFLGVPTAIFRPLPWEGGVAGLGSSLDTLVIAVAMFVLWRQRSTWKTPHPAQARVIVFALVATLVLFAPLAGYGNLGLLARMRSLTVPLLITVIAIAPGLRRASGPASIVDGGSAGETSLSCGTAFDGIPRASFGPNQAFLLRESKRYATRKPPRG